MRNRWWWGALLGASLAGALGTMVVEQAYWDHELKVQLVEKDKLVAVLKADVDSLQAGMAAVQNTNAQMRRLIDASLADADAVAKSNQTSLEKLRGLIVRLQTLQTELKRP